MSETFNQNCQEILKSVTVIYNHLLEAREDLRVCREVLSAQQELLGRMRIAIVTISPERLEALAEWLDRKHPDSGSEVQNDLRTMARLSREVLAMDRARLPEQTGLPPVSQ
jgi:hypothetical protein